MYKVLVIGLFREDRLAINAASYDMLKRPWGIDA
jgi:hypothetical protein